MARLGAAFVVSIITARAAERTTALPPEEALKAFQLEPGLRIELVAAEPLVVSPVAFAFDEQRRLFVVENRGYPDPIHGGTTTLGRIAVLTDTDGDGRYDKRTEFATGLGYVNGILPWRGGIFVTAAPDILYLKDNDGDGIADEKRVVLTGFDTSKTTQLRVSHPTLGFDGKVYVTSGLVGGKVSSPEHPERPAVTFTPRDGRFDPDTFEFENTGGRGQYGLTFDAFGRRFVCSNRQPVVEVMLEPWQLRRNPNLAFAEMAKEVSKMESESKVFPISRVAVTADFMPKLMAAPHAGTFTSACSVFVFGGTALTPDHVGNVFICEPAQNLVQRQVFRPDGAGFRSEAVHPGKEFLASTDTWFRPVFVNAGPDGALYIVDMHRREIDHPVYVPEEARARLDFESGKSNGRIYRIVRRDWKKADGDLKAASTTADVVNGLDSANEWWRARAQRLLVERHERAAIPDVEKIARSASRPESRARALWTLRALKGPSSDYVLPALNDKDAGVREQAVRLAAELAGQSPEMVKPLLTAANDPEPRVRFCVALALAGVNDGHVVPALAAIAARDGADRWTRAAVLTGIGSRMDAFLAAFQAQKDADPKAFAAVMEHLGRIFGNGASPDACRKFLSDVLASQGDLSWRISSVLGLAEGLRGRGKAGAPADVFADSPKLQAFYRAAADRALDAGLPSSERANAVALLGYTAPDFAAPVLGKLLGARQPPDVQVQAVRAVERLGDPRTGALLIAKENWPHYTPQIREAVLATLTSKPELIEVLFEGIRQKIITPVEVSSTRRTQLLKHTDAKVKTEAEAVFKDLEGGDRMEVYRKYRDVLGTSNDIARGREVFMRICSVCHTREGVGGKVGPDLTGIRNQPADAILLHIIVPNYEVYPTYQTLSVTTKDGQSVVGWLSAETESSLTLRTAAGTEETVMRTNVASLIASGQSLMPDGLEQAMDKVDMANLVAFLKSGP